MEEDIQNDSPTVMFRGTPCTCFKSIVIKIYTIYSHQAAKKNGLENLSLW